MGYLIYSFIGKILHLRLLDFIIDNVPRVNQFTEMIDEGTYDVPEMAIAFFYGEPFLETINDPNRFTISMQ